MPGYAIPAGDALSDWQAAFVGQAGQVEKANGRTADAISIYEGCEKLVNGAR